ncbi:MAG: hypothetical protein V4710_00105, partial [Verrucomicrobiota bacterium]
DRLHYGLQFHLEIDRASLREMIAADAEALRGNGILPEEFLRSGEWHLPRVEQIARTLFWRWSRLLQSHPGS